MLKAFISTRSESPRSSRFSGGSSTFSKRTSERYSPPIVWYFGSAEKPGVPCSTIAQPMPLLPGTPSTRVKTMNTCASAARLIRVLAPFSTTLSLPALAFVRMFARSVPASGSVMQIDRMQLPSATFGSHLRLMLSGA